MRAHEQALIDDRGQTTLVRVTEYPRLARESWQLAILKIPTAPHYRQILRYKTMRRYNRRAECAIKMIKYYFRKPIFLRSAQLFSAPTG